MPARRNYYEENWVIYLQCKWCWEFKTSDCFYKHKVCFMWLSSICKECNHKHWVEYHAQHRDEDNRRNKERREINKDKINTERRERYRTDKNFRELCSERSKVWREENKDANLRHHHEYYEQNKDYISERGKKYYQENKEYISNRNKKYYEIHREQLRKKSSEWKKSNRDKMNIYQQWLRERRWPIYAKAHRLVENQLKKIWLKRDSCPMCLKEWIVVCHHPDYNKPYEVVPCCNLCHSQIHRWIIECPKPIDLLKL